MGMSDDNEIDRMQRRIDALFGTLASKPTAPKPVTEKQAEAFVQALQAKTERDQEPKTINIKTNERGFLSGDFEDLNGKMCSIQKSSLATDSAIWLGVYPDGPTRMHLNRQHVAALLPLLQHFVETGELPRETGANDGNAPSA